MTPPPLDKPNHYFLHKEPIYQPNFSTSGISTPGIDDIYKVVNKNVLQEFEKKPFFTIQSKYNVSSKTMHDLNFL